MEEPQTALTFVLVHGSGGGAWSWVGVQQLLEQEGHRVHAPSLSGMSDPETSLTDHVDDVVRVIRDEGLAEVQLVGHSYSGMPITGAAGRVPDRIARLVYLDAFAPEDGPSMSVPTSMGPYARTRRTASSRDAGHMATETAPRAVARLLFEIATARLSEKPH